MPDWACGAAQRVYESDVNVEHTLTRLWEEEEGQDLIEYVLLVALIALLLAATFPALAIALTQQLKEATNCVNKLSKGACK